MWVFEIDVLVFFVWMEEKEYIIWRFNLLFGNFWVSGILVFGLFGDVCIFIGFSVYYILGCFCMWYLYCCVDIGKCCMGYGCFVSDWWREGRCRGGWVVVWVSYNCVVEISSW